MSQYRGYRMLLLGGLAIALTGCDSSYHSFDGNAGFTFKPISIDQYEIEYVGHATDNQKDVEMMWHHAAREVCRGSGYQHRIGQMNTELTEIAGGNELVPRTKIRYSLQGEVICLAPNIAAKRDQPDLTAKHLAADNLERGSATH